MANQEAAHLDNHEDITGKSEPKPVNQLNRPLRILQWNAGSLSAKIDELRCFLVDFKIDIALIQETWLTEKSATPKIKGYIPVRGDRKHAEYPGGGLITYIRGDEFNPGIGFKPNGHCQQEAVEVISVSVQQSQKKWLTINNIYIPRGEMDLSFIPMKDNTIHAGDFNAHSKLWDDEQPEDQRGDEIVDWMLENDLVCQNDGSPTRVNRGTGGLSTPDCTFVTRDLGEKVKWESIDDNDMGSDHAPIVIEVSCGEFKTISNTPLRTRWKRKGINWNAFREEVEALSLSPSTLTVASPAEWTPSRN